MREKFNKILNETNDLFAALFFGGMIITVLMAVVLRYFFGFSFRWTDELTRYLFIYMVFLGIPIAFREKTHVTIQFFISIFPKKLQRILHIFCDLSIFATIIYIGYQTIIMIMGRLGKTPSSGLKIPMGYIYSAVVLCIVLLIIELVQRFIKGYK